MSLKDWEGRVLSAPGASERVRSVEEKVLSHIRYRIRRRVKLRLFQLHGTRLPIVLIMRIFGKRLVIQSSKPERWPWNR